MSFARMWADLSPIGRDPVTGGYHRFAWRPAELRCRAWFTEQARLRGLAVEPDRNGNLFAWWYPEDARDDARDDAPDDARDGARDGARDDARNGARAVLTGSHLDSVPGGGAFDGPLGVVSALAAIDLLRERGRVPARPIVVAVFAEEEGARFGVACLGSRLLTGAIDPARARTLRDAAGVSLAEALAANGLDPEAIGRDDDLLGRIGCFVELHVEQGRTLDVPVGVAGVIWPHGRWRLDFHGASDHAGTTALADRRDPMPPFAETVLAARRSAERHGTLATIGKVGVTPGAANAIPSLVTAWLDARGPNRDALVATVEDIAACADRAGREHGVTVRIEQESDTGAVTFDGPLRNRLADSIAAAGLPRPPVLATGAGHDAGVLSAHLPTAMLFVRNPTGISHAPAEHAEQVDCLAGVEALAAGLDDLASCRDFPGAAGDPHGAAHDGQGTGMGTGDG